MVKVVATSRGYFGGMIRDPGTSSAVFDVPADLWNDRKRRPSWARLAGAGDAAPVDTNKSAAEPIVVPDGWEDLPAADRKALAAKISGQEVKRAPEADKIIDAYVEANKPAAEPFGDAPQPQTIAEAQKENGGIQPDWVAPSGDPKPVAD